MAAVRHELEAMNGEVLSLQSRLNLMQRENELLRAHVPPDVLQDMQMRCSTDHVAMTSHAQQQQHGNASLNSSMEQLQAKQQTPSSPSSYQNASPNCSKSHASVRQNADRSPSVSSSVDPHSDRMTSDMSDAASEAMQSSN